ncbi:MAG: biotin-dependent carboxyltransferase family protein [Alphaproteobacteria bacterium]|jgi:urea carboxylase|nr:biotin-dependent carboxyltransferase family protein [Alphaproteobacteria bacterium]MDP6587899.1 biotin-dependent carboxyltransferase family protein [Alphaproteobacteria bacterium]MDP6819179.1 biotin-dependent carboxyltransferase family protein [Alphaproteobacteria bacterium]
MLEIIKPGLETSIQDFPGRIGYWNQGFPPSGPMDSWSFRLANILVGNDAGAAGLEAQFMGPTIKFQSGVVIAVTGANMAPKLDGEEIPMWESVAVTAGQTLVMGPALKGARGYFAVAGGIDAPEWLGSASTFHKASVGGLDGNAIQAGQVLPVKAGAGEAGRRVKEACRPHFATDKKWQIEAVAGPNDDWIDEAGHAQFLATEWKLEARSDRTGYRLDGPDWTFTEKATDKPPENGEFPSNIVDQGYPMGGINLCGQKPIILVNDGPSMGGFIVPYTVPSAAFWKLGQIKPNEFLCFSRVGVGEAQALRIELDDMCGENSIES